MGFFVGPRISEETRGLEDWLRLLATAGLLGITLELLTAPLDFYSGFMLEHRYQLSNQTFAGWLRQRLKGYAVGGVLGLLLVFGLYWVLWVAGSWWWLAATAGWLVVTLVLGRLLPVVILPIFYKVTPLDDASLLSRLRKLTEGTSLTIQGVYELHLSAETKKANAALAGLGNSRRVLLGDTLLTQFTPEEIEVVFAHEVGHHVHRHLPKSIALSVVSSLIGFWLVDRVLTASAAGLATPALPIRPPCPCSCSCSPSSPLRSSPMQNALSRFYERQSDRYALDARATRSPTARHSSSSPGSTNPTPTRTH